MPCWAKNAAIITNRITTVAGEVRTLVYILSKDCMAFLPAITLSSLPFAKAELIGPSS